MASNGHVNEAFSLENVNKPDVVTNKEPTEQKPGRNATATNNEDYDFNWVLFKLKNVPRYADWRISFAFLSICCFFENFVISGSATVVLSTIEKEFFLTSTESGLFLGIFEVAGFVSAPFFGYLGSLKRINKMRLISLSLLLVFIGSYLIGLSVFIKEPDLNFISNPNHSSQAVNLNLCIERKQARSSLFSGLRLDEGDDASCDDTVASLRNPGQSHLKFQFLLYVGHLIIGLGAVVIYSIGIAYVEEICLPEHSPYCQAIFYGSGSIGGAIGILITGRFLDVNARFYLDSYEPNNWIKPTNPYWIGAWWLPYLIYGAICGVLAIIVFGFPRSTRNKKLEAYKMSQNQNLSEPAHTRLSCQLQHMIKIIFATIKDFFKQLIATLKNLKLVFIILSTATEGIILKGFLGFMSKYVEYQFHMPATTSTMIIGAIALLSVIFGSLLSAWLMNRFKWQTKENAIFCCFLFLITSFCFLILLVYCPETKFIDESGEWEQKPCLKNCKCSNRFNPVCLPSDYTSTWSKYRTFQSPCHAGCQDQLDEFNFSRCKCLPIAQDQSELILSTETCDKDIKCVERLVVNAFGAFVIVFLTAMTLIPHIKCAIGCVGEDQSQSFSLGIRAALTSLIGNFAGSVLVGKAVDLTCKFWLKNCFGQKVCKIYDNQDMSTALALIGFGCRFLTAIFMIVACLLIIRDSKRSKEPTRIASTKQDAEQVQSTAM